MGSSVWSSNKAKKLSWRARQGEDIYLEGAELHKSNEFGPSLMVAPISPFE